MQGQTVKSPNLAAEPGLHTKNAGHGSAVSTSERFARESFTMRRMQSWQIWALAIVAVAAVVLGWLYI